MLRKLYFIVALMLSVLNTAEICAYSWHGIDVQDILDHKDDDTYLNANYPKIKQTYTKVNGKWVADSGCGFNIYLYNVGTGKFILEGGSWGMEGLLQYGDFGRRMMLILEETSPGNKDWELRINPHITEDNTMDKCRFTCNVIGVSRSGSWSSKNVSFTTIMDGFKKYAKWDFERVEADPASESKTFRMSQSFKNPINSTYRGVAVSGMKFRFGAAYGDWYVPNSSLGNGHYVHIGDERSCWTSAGNEGLEGDSPWGNTTKVQVGADTVEIDKLYQWRIISEKEFLTVLNIEVIGLNPSISSLVPDRDFTRNSNDFVSWEVARLDTTYSTDNGRRYGYTWGYVSPGHAKDDLLYNKTNYYDSPWNEPVMLKKAWTAGNNMENAKYGYMSFEGQGLANVYFEVPHPGWYAIEMKAINFAPDGHPAYLYALADGALERIGSGQSAASARMGYQEVPVSRLDNATLLGKKYNDIGFPKSNQNKSNSDVNLAVGKTLSIHGDDFLHEFWIYIDPDYYYDRVEGITGGKGLTLGIRKEHVTNALGGTKDDVSYYYDNDWVVLDDIRVSYMGLGPVFLYEEEESLDYLIYEKGKESQRPAAAPDNVYGGSLNLARTLKKDQWNSFSMPLPLTGEQITYAFGQGAQLLELHSIGGLSKNSNIIDFQSVDLKSDPFQTAVHPGKFYLLKPTVNPINGIDPRGLEFSFYQLGRNYFTVNTHINDGVDPDSVDYYPHHIMDPSVLSASVALDSWNGVEAVSGGNNDGVAHVSYVRTPGYSSFAVNASGKYSDVTAPTGTYAPKGSYVMSSGKIYEINKDTRIKGFRGWIKLTKSLFDTSSSAKISIDGVVDEDGATGIDATAIVPQRLADDTAVYDLGGRKVGTLGMSLPKGIYIVKGRKFMVN